MPGPTSGAGSDAQLAFERWEQVGPAREDPQIAEYRERVGDLADEIRRMVSDVGWPRLEGQGRLVRLIASTGSPLWVPRVRVTEKPWSCSVGAACGGVSCNTARRTSDRWVIHSAAIDRRLAEDNQISGAVAWRA